jgi:hypothetical protein
MDDPETVELHEEREGPHPADGIHRARRTYRELLQKTSMLPNVLLRMQAKCGTGFRVHCVEVDGVELVVSHYGGSRSRVDHAPYEIDYTRIVWTAVYEVSKEQALPVTIGVTPRIADRTVAECMEPTLQFAGLSMYVRNDVVSHGSLCGRQLAACHYALSLLRMRAAISSARSLLISGRPRPAIDRSTGRARNDR